MKMNLIHVLNCRSVEMNLKKVFFKQRATGWPDVLMGPVLNGLARPVNRPTDRAWACKQTRCPIGARPGGTPCQSGPCPYGPCLARARAGPCQAGPLLNFSSLWLVVMVSLLYYCYYCRRTLHTTLLCKCVCARATARENVS